MRKKGHDLQWLIDTGVICQLKKLLRQSVDYLARRLDRLLSMQFNAMHLGTGRFSDMVLI